MNDRDFSDALRLIILELTGNEFGQAENYRLVSKHVQNLMRRRDISTLEALLEVLVRDEDLFDEFISCITIHHTSWFREPKQFAVLEEQARGHHGRLEVLCAACSTGEEAYSIGLVLERVRRERPEFDYRILALDIDQKSLDTASSNVFARTALAAIPLAFRKHLFQGKDDFSVSDEIFSRIRFQRFNLLAPMEGTTLYHTIFLRHLLIYLSGPRQELVLAQMAQRLATGGRIFLGASEAREFAGLNLKKLAGAVFVRTPAADEKKRLLVVEDSRIIQKLLGEIFKGGSFETVYASTLAEADEFIREGRVDAISLDIYLPDGLGTDWLKRHHSRGFRVPTMIVSHVPEHETKETVEDILRYAHGYMEKSSIGREYRELRAFFEQTLSVDRAVDRSAAVVDFERKAEAVSGHEASAILIGASTGGPNALVGLLRDWPADSPPVVVVQHIDKNFLLPFAQSLRASSRLKLWDGVEGPLQPGHLYIALEDYHLKLTQVEGRWHIRKDHGAPENHHRPSVDTLFKSCATSVMAGSLIAVILTGMGRDGAKGMRSLREAGAITLVQDQASSVIWGMPGEAVKLQAAQKIASLADLRALLLETTSYQSRRLYRSSAG